MNACPNLATSFFHYRPLIQDSIEATTILTQGGTATPVVDQTKHHLREVVMRL